MTEDRIRELLREMRDEPVPADSQARVRLAVDERSRSRVAGLRRHWKLAAGILAPACVVLIAMLMREPARVAIPQIQTRAEVPAAEPPALPVIPPAHRTGKTVHPTVPSPRSNADGADTVIRIETEDPDIVIVLVGG